MVNLWEKTQTKTKCFVGNDITLSDIQNCYKNDTKKLHDIYVANGIPVLYGEYGAVDKDNTEKRALYCEGVNRYFKQNQIVGVYWDDGGTDNNAFAIVDREACTRREGYEDIVYSLMRGFFNEGSVDDLTLSPEIKPITSFDVSNSNVTLMVNRSTTVSTENVAPSDNNDVILWKTADANVATVYNGMIRARGIGTTTITAFTQSGTATQEITVTVKKETLADACTAIATSADEIEVEENGEAFLNASCATAGCQASMSFCSEDESIATVSKMGKILGIKQGSTKVIITSSTGIVKEIPVTVTEAQWDNTKIRLALYVYYNDSTHNYFDNVQSSEVITITGPGTYTLKFDCATDLSAEALAAGITNINNAGSVYIKDVDVHDHTIKQSVVKKGRVSWQSVKVNGIELNVKDPTAHASAVKGHILDTDKPLNCWTGMVVDSSAVSVNNYSMTFPGIDNPTTIEVTFTLFNLYYDDDTFFGGRATADDPLPSEEPSESPSASPSEEPSAAPTETPGESPSSAPSDAPTPGSSQPPASVVPSAAPSTAPADTTSADNTFVYQKGCYKVLSETAKTVTYVKPKNVNAKTIKIPAKVKKDGKTYWVTTISAKAFANAKKAKTIQIATTSLTKVQKKAFTGVAKKVVVKVPKNKLKKYTKLLKNGGLPKTAKIKKA